MTNAWSEVVLTIKKLYFNSVYYENGESDDDTKLEYLFHEMIQKSDDFQNTEKDIGDLIEAFSTIVISLLVSFAISWELSIVLVVSILFYTTRFMMKLQTSQVLLLNDLNVSSMSIASHCMRNVRTVASLNCEDHMVENYKKWLELGYNAAMTGHKCYGYLEGVRLFLFHTICAIALIYSNWLYSEKSIAEIGDVFIVLSILFLNRYHYGRLLISWNKIEKARRTLFRYYNKINQFDEEKEVKGLQMEFTKGNIVYDNVYSNQGGETVLKGLMLEIRRGETVGIVGDSASGKNALYNLLTNNSTYTMGKIIIDGNRIEKISRNQIRDSIKIVRGNESVFEGTIMENIRMYRPGITEENIKKCAEVAQLHGFISKLEHGYSTNLLKDGIYVTKYHQQLLAIARCIVTEPKVLFLDDSTSALSEETEQKLLTSLREHLANSIIIIMSDRPYCLEKVDKIFVLEDGVVIEKGSHLQLISKQGKYLEFIKLWEKRRVFSPSTGNTIRRECSIENRFLQGNRNRFSCNYNGIVKLLVGSIFACFLRSIDKPIFLIVCYIFLFDITATFQADWVFTIILGGLLVVWISFVLRNYIGHMFLETFLINLKVLTFRSYLHADRNEMDKMKAKERSPFAVIFMMPEEITEVLYGGLMENVHSCFTILLNSLVTWYLVWELGVVSSIFIFIYLCILVCGCVSDYRRDFKKSAGIDLETLRAVRQLSAKYYYFKRITDAAPEENFYIKMFGVELVMVYDLFSIALSLILLGRNMYSFSSIIIAFVSGHFCQWSLITLKNNSASTMRSLRTFMNIFNTIRSPQEILTKHNKGIKLEISGDIHLKRLSFFYPSNPGKLILKNIDLTIKSGEKVAIYGKSKSGRSTIFQLLQKFYSPSKGCILFDSNNNIEELNAHYLRNQICSVNGDPIIFPGTILENITMGLTDVPLKKVREACKMSNSHHFIESLAQGYDSIIGTNELNLSTSQCLRISLTRALIRNPKILLIDRASALIDTQSREVVEKAFSNASIGRTYIAIVNSLEDLENYDKICIMNDGSIVEAGSHEELMQLNGYYAKMARQL
ncbi:unnamed protein product [Auanema sp. JU1783]|nr:unnamed protein product [Auanema sp. JU1783]